MRVARLLAALLVTVITLEQAKGMQCKTACGWAGYDSGFYRDDQCGCFDLKPYEEFTSKRKLTLPSRGISKGHLSNPEMGQSGKNSGSPITYDFY